MLPLLFQVVIFSLVMQVEISSSSMRLYCLFWDGLVHMKLQWLLFNQFHQKIFGRCLSALMSSLTHALQTEAKQFLYFCSPFLFISSVVPFWQPAFLVTLVETLLPESPNNVDYKLKESVSIISFRIFLLFYSHSTLLYNASFVMLMPHLHRASTLSLYCL